VGGSTLSDVYMYSIILCILLGLLLGPAIALGLGGLWVATVFIAVVALFVGACVVEILDSVTNRISSSFYKKSGRSGIIFRLAITVTILVFIQLLFSGYFINYLLQSALHAAKMAWFIPVVWPSLAIIGLTEANTFSFVSFSILSLAFAGALLILAAEFRARFWVPIPVSIKLTSRAYKPGRFRLPFVGGVESTIILKDFRSLTRRREMARFLAIPFVVSVSMGISMFSITTQSGPGAVVALFIYLLSIAIFVSVLSMTSIGQEGSAVWNIYAAPIKSTQLLRAKILFASGLGVAFGIVLLSIFIFILPSFGAYYWIPLLLGVPLAFEESARGVYIAARSPDFREMVRSRYVGVWAQLAGTGLSFVMVLTTAGLVAVYDALYGSISPEPVLAALIITVLVFVIELKLASNQVRSLLLNIPN
jgi:hypothetical protein